ncbi:MAG: hypothetical protein IH947_15950, partial [Bacteroidetes bacterium]|nr:hypothetical protein [Bacteroidota bacterium]
MLRQASHTPNVTLSREEVQRILSSVTDLKHKAILSTVYGRKLETLEARVDSIRAALSEARIECQDTDIAT